MSREEITSLLATGGSAPPERLVTLLYEELRALAHHLVEKTPGLVTLQPTALVHEAYARLVGDQPDASRWRDHRHFFHAAAQAMRHVLVDGARRRARSKRGGDWGRISFHDATLEADAPDVRAVELHEALEKLETLDPEASEVVLFRVYGGLTVEEAAGVTGRSAATVKREWAFARTWLRREIGGSAPDPGPS